MSSNIVPGPARVLFNQVITSAVTTDSIALGLTPGGIDLTGIKELAIFAALLTFTGTTSIQVLVSTSDLETAPQWFNLNPTAPAWTSAPNSYYTSAGPGTDNAHSIGKIARINWNVIGSPTGVTFQVTVVGR